MGADVQRLPLDPEGETAELARRIRATLTRLGYKWDAKDGHTVQVTFKSLQVARTPRLGPVALLEVDTLRLPARVKIDHLTSAATLHDLTAACGRRVEVLNTTGLTYAVRLESQPRKRLPARVSLVNVDEPPPGPWQIPLGLGEGGAVWLNLHERHALLVAGTTGYGKTVWLNTALAWLLSHNGPDRLRVALVDRKEVELGLWAAAPHTLGPVARDAGEAEALLGQVLGEWEARRLLFSRAGVRNIDTYNDKAKDSLPMVLVVIDELADLAMEAGGPRSGVMVSLARLVTTGRAWGIHLIMATQRPDSEHIPAIIKANTINRLAFYLPDDSNYRVALNPAKGQRLPRIPEVPGRMIARLGHRYHILQGFHLADADLERIAGELAAGRPANLDPGPLSDRHVDMVHWAMSENGGRLTIANIAEYLGLTPYRARVLAEEWAARGWLAKDGPAHLGRRVTGCLLELVERYEAGEWTAAPGQPADSVCGPQTREISDGSVCDGAQ